MTCTECPKCPSFVRRDDVPTRLGIPLLNADMCGRLSKPLSNPLADDDDNAEMLKTIASTCPVAGEPLPAALTSNGGRTAVIGSNVDVAKTMGDAMAVAKVPVNRARSCSGCRYYVPAETMRAKFGFTLSGCQMHGHMITDELASAKACKTAVKVGNSAFVTPSPATPATLPDPDVSTFVLASNLFPEPVDDTPRLRLAQAGMSRPGFLDVAPVDWPTDVPVSDTDRRRFILSWRAVEDPEGKKPPLLCPVFDAVRLFERGHIVWEDVRESYGAHKPHIYVDHQQLLYDLVAMIAPHFTNPKAKRVVPILEGPPGTGKTELAAFFAFMMNLPLTRISFTAASEAVDLIGTTELVVDANGVQITEFRKGRWILGYEAPGVLLNDELNLAREEIEHFLRSAFDSADQVAVEAASYISRRNPYCFPLGAQNPAWDPKNMGANTQADAGFERTGKITVDYPPADVEKKIVQAHCNDSGYKINATTLKAIMNVSGELRKSTGLSFSWGVRSNVKVAALTAVFGFEKAYRRAVTDGLAPEQAEVVNGIVSSYAGAVK